MHMTLGRKALQCAGPAGGVRCASPALTGGLAAPDRSAPSAPTRTSSSAAPRRNTLALLGTALSRCWPSEKGARSGPCPTSRPKTAALTWRGARPCVSSWPACPATGPYTCGTCALRTRSPSAGGRSMARKRCPSTGTATSAPPSSPVRPAPLSTVAWPLLRVQPGATTSHGRPPSLMGRDVAGVAGRAAHVAGDARQPQGPRFRRRMVPAGRLPLRDGGGGPRAGGVGHPRLRTPGLAGARSRHRRPLRGLEQVLGRHAGHGRRGRRDLRLGTRPLPRLAPYGLTPRAPPGQDLRCTADAVARLPAHSFSVRRLLWSPHSAQELWSASYDMNVCRWDLAAVVRTALPFLRPRAASPPPAAVLTRRRRVRGPLPATTTTWNLCWGWTPRSLPPALWPAAGGIARSTCGTRTRASGLPACCEPPDELHRASAGAIQTSALGRALR